MQLVAAQDHPSKLSSRSAGCTFLGTEPITFLTFMLKEFLGSLSTSSDVVCLPAPGCTDLGFLASNLLCMLYHRTIAFRQSREPAA